MTYLDADADLIRSHLPEGTDVPEDSDSLFVLYAVLMRAKGPATQASDVHDAWSAWMAGIDPTHDSIRPYEDLPASVRDEDAPFLTAIRQAAQTHHGQR
jgi:hypothetical protein